MLFHSVDISKLISFQFANIERLEINFVSTVMLILGTNGSGKTSLLRELTPLPSVRSAYELGGRKCLSLTHNNNSYRLISDYTNKTSPHQFIKNDTNLNVGGTTQIQEDLVKQELGYTPEIDSIVTGTYDFAKMTQGLRRSLLMTLNPYELSFVLDHHKRVSSAMRANKANLIMLQERKLLLEHEFLAPDVHTNLINEREQLKHKINLIIEYIHRGDERLQSLLTTIDPTTELTNTTVDWNAYRKSLTHELANYCKYSKIPRGKTQEYEKQLLQTRAMYQERITLLKEQQTEIVQLLNSEQTMLSELTEAELLQQSKLHDKAKQDELAELKTSCIEAPASEDSIELWYKIESAFKQLLLTFFDCNTKLHTNQQLQKIKQIMQHWQHVFHENRLELQRIVEQVESIEKLQTIRLTDIPNEPCAKQNCILYVQFKTSHDRRLAELTKLQLRGNYLTNKNNRLQNYLQARTTALQIQYSYQTNIVQVEDYLSKLSAPKITNFYTKLQHNPISIYHQLATWIDNSQQTYRYRTLQAELAVDNYKQTTQQKIAADEKLKIQQRVAQADSKYRELDNRITLGVTKINQINSELVTLESYTTIIKNLTERHTELTRLMQQLWLNHDKTQLQNLLQFLTTQRDTAIGRLGEIDYILQNQQQLKVRYEEEIIKQLNKLEVEKLEWQWMEVSLSKIPIVYQVNFINSIITTMNHYINKVFSYHFALIPVRSDIELDYRFSAQVGDIVIPDISFCSDAQKEIINLTFRVALMKQLRLQDYPIQLDEIGKSFDTYHKQRLLELLREILDERVVSQMYLVNHNALIHDGLVDADVVVLNSANIMTPAVFNTNVIFNRLD